MMRALLLIVVIFLSLVVSPARAEETIFHEDFRAGMPGWTKEGPGTASTATGPDSGRAVCVSHPSALGPGTTIISHSIPVDKIRDTRVRFSVRIKVDGIATPPQPYNGAKFMLVITTPTGTIYPACNNDPGTYDWRTIAFEAPVPDDAVSAKLVLGIEATTGTAWYTDVEGTVTARAFGAPSAPSTQRIYDSHPGIPRLRGVNVPSTITADDLQTLGRDWHANLIRFQLYWHDPSPDWPTTKFETWVDETLDHLDTLIPTCRRTGIHVLIDIHTPLGGTDSANNWNLFRDRGYEHRFLTLWDRISKRYARNDVVWGYDLTNEPVEADVAPGLMDWHELAELAAKVVRKNDARHAIIVELSPWDEVESLRYFPPLDVPGVVYSVHFYEPYTFTSQGVTGLPTGIDYPGTIEGAHWDASTMAARLADVGEYERRYRVPVYVGEFSAIRWAPNDSAYRWLKDATDIFEKNGWDWTYHAYREWEGWSVEYGSDQKATAPDAKPTDREMLLRGLFDRNKAGGTDTNHP